MTPASKDLDIQAIHETSAVREEEADSRTELWEEDQAKKKGQQDLDERDSILEQRKKYAPALFWVLVTWLAIVIAILASQAWKACGFWLSDPVLIALLGTSTVNVVGLFYVVAKFLFPSKP